MKMYTDSRMRSGTARITSWVMAFILVFSLVAVPARTASADADTLSAELVISTEGLDISGKIALDLTQMMLGVTAAMVSEGETLVDAAAYLSTEALAVDGILMGGAYGIDLTSLAENLPNSIFAPDSGSDYALDEETYNQIMFMLSGELAASIAASASTEDSSDAEAAAAVLVEALSEPMSEAASNLILESTSTTITVNGSDVDVTEMTVTADSAAILGFVEAFLSTVEADAEVQSALAILIDEYATVSEEEVDVTGEEFVQSLVEQTAELLEEADTALTESEVAVVVTVCTSDATEMPVLLSLDLQADGSTITINVLIGEALDFFRLEMLEDGQMGPAIQFEMFQDGEDIIAFQLSVEDELDTASVTLALDLAEQIFDLSIYVDDEISSVSGYFTVEENLFSLVVDAIDGEEFGGTITLNLRSDDSIAMPSFTELTELSEEDFTTVAQAIMENVETLSAMFE